MAIKGAWYKFWGRVWVPPELRNLQEPVILHLSDTPAPFFSALPGLIRQLKPSWIIHTGDLVDDIKLGLNPGYLDHYRNQVSRLIRIFEDSQAVQISLCLGNHDDMKTVTGLVKRCQVICGGARIKCETMVLGISHYGEEALSLGGDICLFGHSLEHRTDLTGPSRLLNGLEYIYIILPVSGKVYQLPYPTGTDDQRLGRGKLGL